MSAQNKFDYIKLRAKLKSTLRNFFDSHGYLEIETPVRITAPAPEEFIEAIQADGKFLRPSPELEMKILLCAGYDQIYQFGSCFRADEHGSKHREEFTMLEWYETNGDYHSLRNFTTSFIRDAAEKIFNSQQVIFNNNPVNFALEPEIITVEAAFEKYTSTSMTQAMIDDTFDELMVTAIEPNLGIGRLTFLCDYPKERAALAKIAAHNPRVAERWELYIQGIELANAYSELIDPVEQKQRFQDAMDFRAKMKMHPYPAAEKFLQAISFGMPPAAGCAMGFDRLAMVFCNVKDIDQVRTDF